MNSGRRRDRAMVLLERGQASVELIAVIPILSLFVVLCLQIAAAGWASWSAENAARAGARAVAIGHEGPAVARRALPRILRDGARITDTGPVRVRVRVRVPRLLPVAPHLTVSSSAALEPADA